jgi:hypothetical protein
MGDAWAELLHVAMPEEVAVARPSDVSNVGETRIMHEIAIVPPSRMSGVSGGMIGR